MSPRYNQFRNHLCRPANNLTECRNETGRLLARDFGLPYSAKPPTKRLSGPPIWSAGSSLSPFFSGGRTGKRVAPPSPETEHLFSCHPSQKARFEMESIQTLERAVTVHPAGHSSGQSSRLSLTAALALRSSLFSGASSAASKEVVSAAREKKFESEHAIFSQGDSVRQVLLLISGCVKLLQVGANGNEIILRLIGPGELIGIAESRTRTHNST